MLSTGKKTHPGTLPHPRLRKTKLQTFRMGRNETGLVRAVRKNPLPVLNLSEGSPQKYQQGALAGYEIWEHQLQNGGAGI